MNQEIKKCQNCKNDFTIEFEDFEFYAKIKVPPPTFCPECRIQRRFTYRNERSFYRNKCAKTGKDLISCFSPQSGIVVYNRDIWWSDDWDALNFGIELDFKNTFLKQFKDLMLHVPMPALFNGRSINSNFCNHIGDFKNGYLVSASWDGENIMYSSRCNQSKDSADNFAVINCELCYEDISSAKLYSTFFAQDSENCNNCSFIYDCKGCSNVFGSVGLRNKQYHIFNEPYLKEEYFNKLEQFNIGHFKFLKEIKNKFNELKLKALRKSANISHSQKITGDAVNNSFNCLNCFDVVGNVRDCKFVMNALDLRDSYDGYGVGVNGEMLYEVIDTGVQASRLMFGVVIWGGQDVYYSYNCHNSSNLFGCIGLRNKQYCILNKQYSKEEYEKLVPKIIKHMNDMPYISKRHPSTSSGQVVYKYGEFFPPELSPFAYNETIAQEYFPLTKEQAIEQGYNWKDPEVRNFQFSILNSQLPDNIKDVKDDIFNQIIECQHKGTCNEQCTEAFKIIPQELEFYRKMNLPLPRLCPNCRHYQRIKQRNPLKLWKRKCQCAGEKSENNIYQNTITHTHGTEPCLNEFETTYSPDRQEIVYCEQCYQQEVV